MRKLPLPVRVYWGLVLFSLAGSLFSRIAHLDPTPIGRPAALLTLLVGCYAGFSETAKNDREAAIGLISVLFLGAGAELVGLATGFPFGRYVYTDKWWPAIPIERIGYFPLQLPFAWLLVVGAAFLALRPALRAWAVPVAALVATVVDQIMEPVMTGSLGYWRWIDHGPLLGGSPVQNAIGWFSVSALAAGLLYFAFRSSKAGALAPAAVLLGHLVLSLGIGLIAS